MILERISAENLDKELSVEVDTVTKDGWNEICRDFSDANIYQTWPYEVVRSGQANVSHVVIKQQSNVIAVAQACLVRIPYLNLGVAYVRWGPLWKRRNCAADQEVFRQAVSALRSEYVDRRRLILRITSNLIDDENGSLRGILEEEGYVFQHRAARQRTILIDIRASLDDLHRGLHQKWRYHLNKARKQNLELVDGADDAFFDLFEHIYDEMVERKRLGYVTDINQSKKIQNELTPDERMRVFLCKERGEVCAGGIVSALGDTGLYLFGATSNRGTKTYGSYLVHWAMLEWIKRRNCQWYDLNGINPVKNPGGYQFKLQLAGTQGVDTYTLGQFDAYPSTSMKLLLAGGDAARAKIRSGREYLARLCR